MKFGSVLVWLAAFAAGVEAQGGLAALAENMPKCSVCTSHCQVFDDVPNQPM